MVRPLLLSGLLLLAALPVHSQSYSPPAASTTVIAQIRFDIATPLDPKLHQRFQECDTHDTCDGHPARYKCSTDPSRNTVFLKLSDGTIFFDAKMAIDADGA